MTGDTNEEHLHQWEREAAQRLDAQRAALRRRFQNDGLPAGHQLRRLMAGGLGISLLGWCLFIGGSDSAVQFGLALSALGSLVSLVAAVGFGVSLGIRDADERRGR